MDNRQTLEAWGNLQMEMRPKIRYWLPAAAMDEKDLRTEIRQLKERGFGGVEAVVLASLPDEIAKSEDGWGTKNWERMIGIIADETKKLGMSMDIAIGPGWPIASPAIRSADDPAALCELVWGMLDIEKGKHYCGPLPGRRTVRPEGTPELVHVLAYMETGENTLVRDSYIDLMPYVSEGKLEYRFPDGAGNGWKLFAFYRQPSCHKINSDQTYAIDHLSVEGARACEKYWDGVFAENTYDSMESFFCDSLEYNVALDWTPDFLEEFEKRRGYSILPYLPFIGLDNLYPACDLPGCHLDESAISDMVNNDYTEVLTQCYCENHLAILEKMAEKYGKTIRYQVAYNKPFEEERSAFYVAIPENEALGRAFMDGQKLMAAAAHLGRKERYSFECAAQFGHSYGQNYEDLFWWVKRSLMSVMNAQVLHGASYSGAYYGSVSVDGKIPGTEWPGYEGFGKFVSNYWNRTLSVRDAKGCMDTITRLNTIFRKQAKVDCAIFRCSYSNDGAGSDHAYYPDNGKLINSGYSWEMVSDFLLHLPVCKVTNGQLDEEGVGYRCLIIPEQKAVSLSFIRKAQELARSGLPVVWVGEKPKDSLFYADVNTPEKKAEWEKAMDDIWEDSEIRHVDRLETVPDVLKSMGVTPRTALEGIHDVMTAVRTDSSGCYYALYGYNRVEYAPDDQNPDELSVSALYRKGSAKGSYSRPGMPSRKEIRVRLEGTGTVLLCNPWNGKVEGTNFQPDGNGYMAGTVQIEEDELLLFYMKKNQASDACFMAEERYYDAVHFDSVELQAFGPETEGETSFLRSCFAKDGRVIKLGRLAPWKELEPELLHFSGRGIYRGTVTLADKRENCRYLLELGEVSDTFTVKVNGRETEFPDQVMKRVDITEFVGSGDNFLEAIVTSNLYNRLFHENMITFGIPVPYLPRDYGIWETKGKKIALLKQQVME